MWRSIVVLACFCCCAQLTQAQVVDFVIEQIDNEGKIPGKTYRVFARMTNEGDQLLVVYGDSLSPLFVRSSKPFYQHPMGGYMAKNASRKNVKTEPKLAFDSWITIGGVDNYDCMINSLNMDFSAFEASGSSIEVPRDGAWFTLPTDMASKAGADKKILIGQFTTEGSLEGQMCVMSKLANGESVQQRGLKFKKGK